MKRFQIDLRLAVAAILALVTGIVVHAATAPPPTVTALVAAAPLAPGTALLDLEVTTRALAPVPGLVPADAATALGDHTLIVALEEGEPLLESLLAPPPGTRPDVMALTLDPGHAVQGDLLPGDRVDIYVTVDGATRMLATSVLVMSAETAAGGVTGGGTALILAVDRDLARRLLEAVHTADIDLVRRAR